MMSLSTPDDVARRSRLYATSALAARHCEPVIVSDIAFSPFIDLSALLRPQPSSDSRLLEQGGQIYYGFLQSETVIESASFEKVDDFEHDDGVEHHEGMRCVQDQMVVRSLQPGRFDSDLSIIRPVQDGIEYRVQGCVSRDDPY